MVSHHHSGVTWDEAWGMSPQDRYECMKYVNEIVEEQNAQITGKRQM